MPEPGKGKTKTGWLSAYVRDGRAATDTVPPAIAYVYSPDRKGEQSSRSSAASATVMTTLT